MDESDALRWERRARELLQRLAAPRVVPASIVQAIQITVDEICRATGWPVGHALVASDGVLASIRIWHLDDPARFRALREISESQRFGPGVGLPGRVLASGEPLWITDVTADENFPRAQLISDLEVRAAFALPVVVRGTVHAVLEFFSTAASPPDRPLLEVMAASSTQLGRTIERMLADEALRRSEQQFRSVVQTANDAIISTDSQGQIVFWNRGATDMFGHGERDMLGVPLTAIIPERFRAAHAAGIARVRAGGERRVIGRTVELFGLHRDGREFPIELSLAAWGSGSDTFYTGIIRDISRALEASRAKTTFLANMSHELRTPLNAILGFVQLMSRDQRLDGDQRANLAVIMRSGEHLLGLINDVLSISKIEAGHYSLDTTTFALDALLGSVRDMFQARAQAKGLELRVATSGVPAHVRGDEAKLRQVLINLVSNALKFTDRGHAALHVDWRDNHAEIAVADSGRGIEPALRDAIFDPFVQGATATHVVEGTGLGLAISRNFVRIMGGELRVESRPGEGTLFRFTIPLPIGDAGTLRAPARRVLRLQPGQRECRILIVENDPDNRRLLAALLALVGFAVREAADGRAGVAEWTRWRPHLVFMDMRMPVMDGYEATRQIRASEASAPGEHRTAIIGLTASAFEHDRPHILAAGCDEVIAKPFRDNDLLEAIARRVHVAFEYADEPAAEAPAAQTLPLPERLAALPAPLLAKLERALIAGDDLAARHAAEAIAERDATLAGELVRMIAAFELAELLEVIERVPESVRR
jgi:PAS domain S-box-containing protein